jgi:hypothetical protein
MINQDDQLLMALIDAALFFEFSGPTAVNSDSAVGALEQMAARLMLLPMEDRKKLNDRCVEIAVHFPEEARDFVRNFGKNIGFWNNFSNQ